MFVLRLQAVWHICVRGTRTQPLICVGCSVHYWVSCAINKGGFFEIAFVVVVDTHLPRFEALAYVLPHFDELTHVVIRASSSVCWGLLFSLRKAFISVLKVCWIFVKRTSLRGLRPGLKVCSEHMNDWQYLSLGDLEQDEFFPKVNLEVFLCLNV